MFWIDFYASRTLPRYGCYKELPTYDIGELGSRVSTITAVRDLFNQFCFQAVIFVIPWSLTLLRKKLNTAVDTKYHG